MRSGANFSEKTIELYSNTYSLCRWAHGNLITTLSLNHKKVLVTHGFESTREK